MAGGRITRIGAHLVLTVHGEHAFAAYENAMIDNGGDATAEREPYSGHGVLFMPEEAWQAKGFPEWYGSAYHTTRYVFSHWARWFRIKAYLPQGGLGFQDVVVLERMGDGAVHGEYLRQPASAPHATAGDGLANPARAAAEAALARAQRLLASGPDTSSRSRLGAPGNAWRRVLARLIANYAAAHERQVDEALVEAVRAQIEQ